MLTLEITIMDATNSWIVEAIDLVLTPLRFHILYLVYYYKASKIFTVATLLSSVDHITSLIITIFHLSNLYVLIQNFLS